MQGQQVLSAKGTVLEVSGRVPRQSYGGTASLTFDTVDQLIYVSGVH